MIQIADLVIWFSKAQIIWILKTESFTVVLFSRFRHYATMSVTKRVTVASEIRTAEFGTHLKSKLLGVQISDTPMCLKTGLWVWISYVSQNCLKSETENSDFRHILKKVSVNWTLSSDFRHFTKVSEIWTQKFRFQTQSENWTLISDFRQCLKFKLFGNQTVIDDCM